MNGFSICFSLKELESFKLKQVLSFTLDKFVKLGHDCIEF